MAITIVSGPVINANQSMSSILDASNASIWQIIMPAVWEGQPELTFQSSLDGINFYDVYEPDGRLLSVKAMSNSMVFLTRGIWRSAYFKFRSGTPQVATIQTRARTFTCTLMPIA